ncbi:uncharacterized protein LOC125673654 isoform X4 [Ostrea edulis]|nr:uncharacterized protein LOC125673654 isoform X4 [Ostrea edulis]
MIILAVCLLYRRWRQPGAKRKDPHNAEEMGLLDQQREKNPSRKAHDGRDHWPHRTSHQIKDDDNDISATKDDQNLHICVTTHTGPDSVRWQKDDTDINTEDQSEKYLSIWRGNTRHVYLYVYDVDDKDYGTYRVIWKTGEEEHSKEIEWPSIAASMNVKDHHKRERNVREVLMRQYGNDLRIRVTGTQPPSHIKWMKDDKDIDFADNSDKYLQISGEGEDENHFYLYIFNTSEEDSGSYKATWKEGNTPFEGVANIHLEALRLVGPNIKTEKDRGRDEKVDKMKNIVYPIFPEEGTYRLVITQTEIMEKIPKNYSTETFSHFEDKDMRRFLHYAILMSEDNKICWKDKTHVQLLEDIRKLMRYRDQITVEDYKRVASDLNSLTVTEENDEVTFASEQVMLETLWAFMQNKNTKETIRWIFQKNKVDLVLKYFRSPDYQRHEEEICLFLPPMLFDAFQLFFIEKYTQKNGRCGSTEDEMKEMKSMTTNGYVFRQLDSSHLQCIMHYCLLTEDKLSKDAAQYFRTAGYKSRPDEDCLILPEEYTENLIQKLNVNILTHATIKDVHIHDEICKQLRIPQEVISWSDDAKRRFVHNFHKGSIEMFRARGMIVGCAGAGKTTILRRLQREKTKDVRTPTETTIGLEVHDDIFEIIADNLEDFKQDNESGKNSKDATTANLHENKRLISMTDFAGQVAYYACHQIYLSRRAFYLLVIDMSKNLKDIAYNPERHNPIGSLFENWTYEEYFVFWLQSIKTYCDDKKMKEKYGEDAGANPVILIASHRDQLETENLPTEGTNLASCFKTIVRKPENTTNRRKIDDQFYAELENCLPKEQTLKSHISTERYFEVECPPGDLSEEQEDIIDRVRKCIVQTATSLAHWGEKIPIQWSYFEEIVHEKKKEKILKREDLWKMDSIQFSNKDDMDDMLRFYQEIGQIIYFSDEGLQDMIILDVQWFVDAFKTTITDPTHVQHVFGRPKEWDVFMETGKLSDTTLCKIWKKNDGESYIKHKMAVMPYMEKLGILAKVKSQEVKKKSHKKKHVAHEDTTYYYIPSINKKDLKEGHKQSIDAGNKTPVFIFYFENYLPHFFFYRLVVSCFQKWDSMRDDLFFKNAAFYSTEGGNHNIAIAVSKTSIQLQVFTPAKNIKLKEVETKSIRSIVEDMINEITTTFHEQVDCKKGFACKDLKITEEDEDMFLNEEDVADLETNHRPCPKHVMESEPHLIDRDSLLKYWYTVSLLKYWYTVSLLKYWYMVSLLKYWYTVSLLKYWYEVNLLKYWYTVSLL